MQIGESRYAVIFASSEDIVTDINCLKVLLVKRSNHPSIGYWALPGGFVNMQENLEDTAGRELEEETGVKGLILEQFAVYGDYDRDPRTRVITTAYDCSRSCSDDCTGSAAFRQENPEQEKVKKML